MGIVLARPDQLRSPGGYLRGIKGVASDVELAAFVSVFDKLGASWCGYPPASATVPPTFLSTTYTHYIRGGLRGGHHDPDLVLPVRPVTSVTSVNDDPLMVWGTGTALATTDYWLDGVRGTLTLLPKGKHGAWSRSGRPIKIVYVAGFAETTIDDRLVHACGLQVAAWWRLRDQVGVSSVSQSGKSVQLREPRLDPAVKQALAPFVLPYSLVAG